MKFGDAEYERVTSLSASYLRPVTSWSDQVDGTVLPVFEPPLSAAEQAILADIQAMAKSRQTADMTLAEYQGIKPFLASEQTWQAITRNAFVNMTDGDMRRAVYDIITAEVRIARAMRRDG